LKAGYEIFAALEGCSKGHDEKSDSWWPLPGESTNCQGAVSGTLPDSWRTANSTLVPFMPSRSVALASNPNPNPNPNPPPPS